VRWLAESNGIEILQPASIKSDSPATKLLTALTAVSALSIEVWIQPANITQTKFAHILSFAQGWRAWNFVLAQTYADVLFRVRTPLTGYERDVRGHLHTDDGFLTTERLHLVATYKDGVERLYVNGTERIYASDLATEGLVGFPLGFLVQKNQPAKLAYSFFYFFPLACLSAVVISPQRQGVTATLLLSMAMVASLVNVIEIVQAIAFDRAIDLPLLGYGVLTGMIGALSGIAFTHHSHSLGRPTWR
jgi:concanavalin A-like lectin/glucanase superfamily protein